MDVRNALRAVRTINVPQSSKEEDLTFLFLLLMKEKICVSEARQAKCVL